MNATCVNISLPTPTPYFIFNFSIIYCIFIENKCLYDVIWDLKERKKFVKMRILPQGDCVRNEHIFFHLKHLYCC